MQYSVRHALVGLMRIKWIQIVKYDADREIMNTYENLQIVLSQLFPDKLIFIYIRSNSNSYWFIGIQI